MSQGVSIEDVQQAITTAIPAELVLVEDESGGCGAKFSIIVVANAFEGKKLLERQREVNKALEPLMSRIHAVSMKTWTKDQYAAHLEKQQNL